MHGISTKLGAAIATGALWLVLAWVLFDPMSFGPGWTPPPDPVADAIQLLLMIGAGYSAPEKAPNSAAVAG